MSEEKNSNFLIPGSIVVAGVIVALAIFATNGGFSRPGSSGIPGAKAPGSVPTPTPPAVIAGNLEDDDPMLGNPSAPVTFVEFGDFQCPFCGRFFKTTEPQIIDAYVKTGKIKFVYRDFAFLGQESEWAAMAAECANEQGKFWAYHDYLYNHQAGENQGAFAKASLKGFAAALGLDTAKFNQCLDSDKYLDEVKKDTAAGRAAGVSGTPSSFVNGRIIVGALPFDQFKTVIDQALAGK